jgi:hypothetical protein
MVARKKPASTDEIAIIAAVQLSTPNSLRILSSERRLKGGVQCFFATWMNFMSWVSTTIGTGGTPLSWVKPSA